MDLILKGATHEASMTSSTTGVWSMKVHCYLHSDICTRKAMNTEPLCTHHSNGVLFSESNLLYCVQVYEVTHAVGDLPPHLFTAMATPRVDKESPS